MTCPQCQQDNHAEAPTTCRTNAVKHLLEAVGKAEPITPTARPSATVVPGAVRPRLGPLDVLDVR